MEISFLLRRNFFSSSFSLQCAMLDLYHYMIIFSLCRIRERKESVTVLLCGTSGCGKSTLSALLVFVLNTLILIVAIIVYSVSTNDVIYFIV
jgi:pantothenate kinase-related protein Tda10